MNFKVLCSALALSTFLLLTPLASATSFTDVNMTDPYAKAIEYVYNEGIMFGRDTGDFDPTGTVTRGEMAAVICRLLMIDTTYRESGFSDCKGHWADEYVAEVASQGIVNGYGDGNFGPSDTVTYEQAVTMIVRALGYDPQAKGRGGYPGGYLSLADSQGLLAGIHSMIGAEFTRAEVAQLAFNGRNLSGTSNVGSDTAGHFRIGEYSREQDTLTISEIHPDGSFEFSVSWYRLAGIGPTTAYPDGERATFHWEYYDDGDLMEDWSGYIDFLDEESVALTITNSDFIYESEIRYTVFSDFISEEENAQGDEDSLRFTLLQNTDRVGWIQAVYDHGDIFGKLPDSFLRFYPDGTIEYWLVEPFADGPEIHKHQGNYTLNGTIITIDGYSYDTLIDHGATDHLYLEALGDDPYHFSNYCFDLETHDFYVWYNQ